MFKKIATCAGIILFVLSMAGAALPQEAQKQAPMSQPAPSKGLQGKQFVGELVKVDAKAKKIVVKGAAGEKQFDIANATLGGYGSIADMKPGEKVAILFEEKGKKLTAKVVMNHSAMMKGAPQAPAPAK